MSKRYRPIVSDLDLAMVHRSTNPPYNGNLSFGRLSNDQKRKYGEIYANTHNESMDHDIDINHNKHLNMVKNCDCDHEKLFNFLNVKCHCALAQVPIGARTRELCIQGIKKNPYALNYFPLFLRTREVYEEAIKTNPRVMKYIPEKSWTPEFCQRVIELNCYYLKFVPMKMRSEAMCMMAVKKSYHALMYVPEDLMTFEICHMAIKNDTRALSYIPDGTKTDKFYRDLVESECELPSWILVKRI